MEEIRAQTYLCFRFSSGQRYFRRECNVALRLDKYGYLQKNILKLKKLYTLISLSEANSFMLKNKIRFHNYATLTADDGWLSQLNILPWLYEQNIPITLFLNPSIMIGESVRENGMDRLMTVEQIKELMEKYSNITIAPHGWNHNNCDTQDTVMFSENVSQCLNFFSSMDGYVPFFCISLWETHPRARCAST